MKCILNDYITQYESNPLNQYIAIQQEEQTAAPTYDAKGNITEYIDVGVNIVAQYKYSAFGEIISQSGMSFTHRFSTKPYCTTTCLCEYQFRKYDPVLGRWLSRDPIEEAGGLNLYVFCENSVPNIIDIKGYIPLDTIWDIGNIIYDICVGDEVALAADTAALVVPYVPAGTTKLVKTARLSKVEKICPVAKKLEVTYKYIHVDYHFTKGP